MMSIGSYKEKEVAFLKPSACQGKAANEQKASKKRSVGKLRILGWLDRLAPTRLTSRIIFLNLLGLVLLVGGILYFNQTRTGLIAVREESLMTQARIMAAALASAATSDNDTFSIDPDLFLEQQLGSKTPAGSDPVTDVEFPINPEQAGRVLRKLVPSTTTRARVFDRDGQMIVDSRHFYGRGEILRFDLPPPKASEQNRLAKLWAKFNSWLFANNYPLQKPYGLDNGKEFSEIRIALTGLPVTKKAVNSKNEIIVIVAVPIQRFKAVQGALILSTKGGEIDNVLKKERKVVLLTFIVAFLVVVLLSLSLAGHIAEPVRRLSAAADKIRRGVQTRVEIPDFTYRRDEVGHLSGSMRAMMDSLYKRIDAIESFAADVAHEIKNPLTSLRSAVETLELAKTDQQRARLIEVVKDDVKRMDRLISDISDASRLDAELVRDQATRINLLDVLKTVVEFQKPAAEKKNITLELQVEAASSRNNPQERFSVMGHDNRLGQVVVNLLSNAISFAPENSTIKLRLRREGEMVEFSVIDAGPGIPEDNLAKIFKRFYTDRPDYAFGKNSGLGLSISRQIVEAYGGSISARNRNDKRGAVFTVLLPCAEKPNRKNVKNDG